MYDQFSNVAIPNFKGFHPDSNQDNVKLLKNQMMRMETTAVNLLQPSTMSKFHTKLLKENGSLKTICINRNYARSYFQAYSMINACFSADSTNTGEFQPWGKPGAGAPIRTKSGNVAADYGKRKVSRIVSSRKMFLMF